MGIFHAVKHRPRFWDGLIAALALAGIVGIILFSPAWKMAAAAALAFLLYCCFVEPWMIVVKRLSVPIGIKEQLTVAFVADFHVGPYKGKGFMKRIAEKTNAQSPDLILLGGDFLYSWQSDPALLEPLKLLKAPLGVFAVMGNHDSGRDCLHGRTTVTQDRTEDVEAVLDACGITVLHNERITVEKDGSSFVLAGTDDVWMESYDLGKTLAEIPADLPVILLTHNPDAVLDERTLRADLILSGHTHGGQVRLPFFGPVWPAQNITGKTYNRGTFGLPEKTTLVVSQGVGESMARPRFLTVPEIVLIDV